MDSKTLKKVKNITKTTIPTLKKNTKLKKYPIRKKKALKQKRLATPIINSSSKEINCNVKKLISKFSHTDKKQLIKSLIIII